MVVKFGTSIGVSTSEKKKGCYLEPYLSGCELRLEGAEGRTGWFTCLEKNGCRRRMLELLSAGIENPKGPSLL